METKQLLFEIAPNVSTLRFAGTRANLVWNVLTTNYLLSNSFRRQDGMYHTASKDDHWPAGCPFVGRNEIQMARGQEEDFESFEWQTFYPAFVESNCVQRFVFVNWGKRGKDQ